jgi:DnaJ family protein A protein 2
LSQCYYEILGISKQATDAEIKKAFRKQAMIHHPDKGGEPEKFKDLNKAYDTLQDKVKKGIYDTQGEEGLKRHAQGNGGGEGAAHPFAEMFANMGMGGFANMGGHHQQQQQQQQQRRQQAQGIQIEITLEELYLGCEKTYTFSMQGICANCNATGSKTLKKHMCVDCNGKGAKVELRQLGPGMIQQIQLPCTNCRGTGIATPENDKCATCKGQCSVTLEKKRYITLVPGQVITQPIIITGGYGQIMGESEPRDLAIIFNVKQHSFFQRIDVPMAGALACKKEITLGEALTGFEYKIDKLDGSSITVRSPQPLEQVLTPGAWQCIRGHGMPIPGGKNTFGDLYIEYAVTFPKASEIAESCMALRALLPLSSSTTPTTSVAQETSVCIVSPQDIDMTREIKSAASNNNESRNGEDDDDDIRRSHQRQSQQRQQQQAGCQQQ